MEKIIILNGAGKKNGSTATMVKAFADAAGANGNEVREFALQSMTIHGCLDCGGCRRKEKGKSSISVVRTRTMLSVISTRVIRR